MVTYKDTKLLCCKRKHNIFFGKGNYIVTYRKSIHRIQREDGVGVRGHQEEPRVTGIDTKFKWASFVMSDFHSE